MKKFFFFFFIPIFISVQSHAQQTISIWNGQIAPITKGEGTEQNPYLIENAQQFAFLSTHEAQEKGLMSANFKLMTDIDLNNLPWTPIGNPQFSGVFDGNGHIVKNINIYLMGKPNPNDWNANLAYDFNSWRNNWTDASQATEGKRLYEFRNGNLRFWTEEGSKQRPKMRTRQQNFTLGTYYWRVYISDMERNAKVSIGAFLYHDDTHEVDFEIGSGTEEKRTKYNAKDDEVLMYFTSQSNPWYQSIHCIKSKTWYDLGMKLTETEKKNYKLTWLVNGEAIDSVQLEYGKQIPFGIFCSLENLEFMGDKYSTREHHTFFNKVGFTPIDKLNDK